MEQEKNNVLCSRGYQRERRQRRLLLHFPLNDSSFRRRRMLYSRLFKAQVSTLLRALKWKFEQIS